MRIPPSLGYFQKLTKKPVHIVELIREGAAGSSVTPSSGTGPGRYGRGPCRGEMKTIWSLRGWTP